MATSAWSVEERELIARYEHLRARLSQLEDELDVLDAQLIALEDQLPEAYVFAGDCATGADRQAQRAAAPPASKGPPRK
jgi:hypothetical protein